VGQELQDREGNSILVHVQSTVGNQPFLSGFRPANTSIASHVGEVTIELSPASQRDHSGEEIIALWRELVGPIAGVVELSFRQETSAGGNAIDIELTSDNFQQLRQSSEWLQDHLATIQGVRDITSNDRLGKEEIVFEGLTPKGRSLGFTLQMVASQIRASFYGNEVQRIQRGRDEVKVLVRLPKEQRSSLSQLEALELISPAGHRVPIGEVLQGVRRKGTASIQRVNGKRAIQIAADVDTTLANANEVRAKLTSDGLQQMLMRYPRVSYAYQGEQKDQANSIAEMFSKALFALLLMYVLMAIPLQSYVQPFIIMSVIPFGVVGAVFGHWLLDLELSIMSMCGVVALSGVVVNDSLVLVEYVNRKRAESMSLWEAVTSGGMRRFRPIVLTSLTTFAGLIPMLAETDMQARFLIPMAVSLAFGILFATFICLFLVPSIYMMLEDLKNLLGKIKKLFDMSVALLGK